MSSDPTRYPPGAGDYLERLKTYALYVAAVLAVSLTTALVQRFVGVPVEVPPPPVPQLTVVVQPQDGAPPTVTVFPTPTPTPVEK